MVEHQLARLQAARQYEAQLAERSVDEDLNAELECALGACVDAMRRNGDRRRDANGDANGDARIASVVLTTGRHANRRVGSVRYRQEST